MTTQLRIDGPIDSGTAQRVRDALAAANGPVEVFVNSPGGEVGEGLAIYNALRGHAAGVSITIDGFALSVSSAIACAGRPTRATATATLMLHNVWSSATGDSNAMRKSAEALDTVNESLITIYSTRTGKPREAIRELMAAETWLTAQQAADLGLIDEVITDQAAPDEATARAHALYAATHFKNTPTRIQNMSTTTTTTAPTSAAVLAAESARRSEIRTMFGAHAEAHRDLLDAALDDSNATADATSRKLLARLAEGSGPIAGAGMRWSEPDRLPDFQNAATDALLQRAGLPVTRPHAGARDLARMSLTAMATACHSMRHGGGTPRYGFSASHTSSDFPYLLAATAGKALQLGYENEQSSHLLWTRQVEVADFKPQYRIARSAAPALLEVAEGAEYTQGTFGERRETYALTTCGRYFEISRQALVNDDLDSFTRLPAAFGQAAKRKEADEVYSLLASNPTMADGIALFHSSHANLAGSGGSLALATLGAARAAMRRQTGPGGLGYLNVAPAYLVVPASLETHAEELIASTSRADVPNPEKNDFVRSLKLAVDPRLDDSSLTAWYLACNPAQCDTLEIARLAGSENVVIEEDHRFETGAFRIKATLDFGVGALDHRGLYKNLGA
ncbi:MAG: Clp protease ClpP [Xanthomonadales bacterium]|nr:Clp protease ClpP [Xanthomonadales bacterium]